MELRDYWGSIAAAPAMWIVYPIHANHGIPKGAVVELIAYNSNPFEELEVGLRNAGSSLERILDLHEAEGGGYVTARFLVTVDASGNIEYYRNADNNYGIRINGYWTGIEFVETWIELSVLKAEQGIWTNKNLYISDSIPKEAVCHALLTNAATGNEEIVGVRTDGSSLERKIAIHEAEGGGINPLSMFVKTSVVDGIIEVYMEDKDTDRVIIGGYFGSDMDFTELMTSKDVSASATWEEHDLSGDLDEDGRVTDFLLTNIGLTTWHYLGARIKGSSINRYILEHIAEAGGHTGFGISVKSDANGVVELYCGNADYDAFYLTGYFIFEIVIVAPTVTTQAATGIGFD